MLAVETSLNSEIQKISGLTYIPDFIEGNEQASLIEIIDQQQWSIKEERRLQEYGYKYDFENGSFVSATYLGNLPDWIQPIAQRLFENGLIANVPDQVIVNEYQPGQGIVSHIDCTPCFGNTIIILSLGSSCVMNFTHSKTHEEVKIFLQPGSLIISQKEARYSWWHGISACQKDNYKGQEVVRKRRISLTFREVLFPYK
ncbi:MAG: alpha-ketoglutarate-dependent dioxygenase AlkB [Coleofasciculaceae cyanobacterium]